MRARDLRVLLSARESAQTRWLITHSPERPQVRTLIGLSPEVPLQSPDEAGAAGERQELDLQGRTEMSQQYPQFQQQPYQPAPQAPQKPPKKPMRANQAWAKVADDPAEVNYAFEHQRAAFEEGWETGYETRSEEVAKWLENLSDSVGDGAQRELFYDLAQEIRGKEVPS